MGVTHIYQVESVDGVSEPPITVFSKIFHYLTFHQNFNLSVEYEPYQENDLFRIVDLFQKIEPKASENLRGNISYEYAFSSEEEYSDFVDIIKKFKEELNCPSINIILTAGSMRTGLKSLTISYRAELTKNIKSNVSISANFYFKHSDDKVTMQKRSFYFCKLLDFFGVQYSIENNNIKKSENEKNYIIQTDLRYASLSFGLRDKNFLEVLHKLKDFSEFDPASAKIFLFGLSSELMKDIFTKTLGKIHFPKRVGFGHVNAIEPTKATSVLDGINFHDYQRLYFNLSGSVLKLNDIQPLNSEYGGDYFGSGDINFNVRDGKETVEFSTQRLWHPSDEVEELFRKKGIEIKYTDSI